MLECAMLFFYVINVLIVQFAHCGGVCNIAKSPLSAHYLPRGTYINLTCSAFRYGHFRLSFFFWRTLSSTNSIKPYAGLLCLNSL